MIYFIALHVFSIGIEPLATEDFDSGLARPPSSSIPHEQRRRDIMLGELAGSIFCEWHEPWSV